MQIIVTLLSIVFQCTVLASTHPGAKTILINPAGDAHNLGRTIDGAVERTLTLQCAEQLQQMLSHYNPHLTVLLTRKAGEVVPFLQNAHFANCLTVDLSLSIHLYQEQDIRPHVFIYTYKDTNFFIKPDDSLVLYPYHHAYLYNQPKTTLYANMLAKELTAHYEKQQVTIHTPLQAPMSPLIGIMAPALMIEIGIKKSTDWTEHIEPLAQAIMALF
jgi:N-acetylmuramoyl-L-alanine amidase